MHSPRTTRAIAFALAVGVLACGTDPQGLWKTPAGSGPTVKFDLLAKPLPDIPFPNDIATRPDADSPTGRRVNAAIVAPTILEGEVRREFNLLDGFGTLAPITVSFDKPIDPNDVRRRHLDDDFSNDAVYVVNLKTGEPVMVDMGRGNFPVVVKNNDKYFYDDPSAETSNLLFPADNTVDPTKPAAGVTTSSGDVPTKAAPGDEGNDQYRDLLTFYERSTNTLIIRPVVPLDQRTPYAVVLTNRIKGLDGQPVRSPFPFVNHAAETEELQPLAGFLGKGKLAGVKPADVAFAWSFTTQSVTTDLEAIRDGLYGKGKLGWIGSRYDDKLEPVTYVDKNGDGHPEEHPVHPMRDSKIAARDGVKNVYTVPISDFVTAFSKLTGYLGVSDGPDKDAMLETYKFVDYFVIGSFKSPDFLDDPQKPMFDAVFRVNAEAGTARVWARPDDWKQIQQDALDAAYLDPTSPATALARQKEKLAVRDRVWFMLAVPKAHDGFKAPFPTAIYGHGYTSNRPEMLGLAGNLAKFGIATVAIDSYGHGLDVNQTDRAAITAIINSYGFGPLTEALFEGRARDLDNDLIDDSGGDFWVADTFHTRDVVRQSIVDWMQLIRVFHAFGTYKFKDEGAGVDGDVNGDGKDDLAGDFNGDGVVDVGGPEFIDGKRNPGYDFFVWGQSLGGILSGILPAVEPSIAAAAPTSGGGGLADIGIRSEQGGVIEAVFLELFGPFVEGRPRGDGKVDLYYEVQNVNHDASFRISGPDGVDIREGDTVTVENLDTKDGQPTLHDSAVAGPDGKFRLQVAADNASFLDGAPVDSNPVHLGVCDPETAKSEKALMMRHPADCLVFRRARPGAPDLVVDKFGEDVVFQGRHVPQGSPLVALARGFGMKRGTSKFRNFMSLAQTILEPADPGNYATHYFKDLLPARKGNPAAVLVVGTSGDLNVPVNTAYTQARAAGVLPYTFDPTRDAQWGMSPNDVLIQAKATECLAKLQYFTPVADHLDSPDAAVSPRDQKLVDLVECENADDCRKNVIVDPGRYAFDPAQGKFLDVGNKLDSSGLQVGYTGADGQLHGVPRLKFDLRAAVRQAYPGTDAEGKPATRTSALITPYLEQTGKHGFDIPHPQDPFDIDMFMINMIGHFFESRGTDLRYDVCMNKDGYDRPRLLVQHQNNEVVQDPDAQRVPACDFIPAYPDHY